VLPDEATLLSMLGPKITNITDPIVSELVSRANSMITKFKSVNITESIRYEPDMSLYPPNVTNNSINFFLRGNLYLSPVGYINVSYPEAVLNFTSNSDNSSSDNEFLMSP